jgi:NAD-dependent DNA ligase
MASIKPTTILKSKSDLSSNEIELLSDEKAWSLIYELRLNKAKDNRLQVCFTGFGISKKAELVEHANNNQLKTVSSITKKLDYLVGGENAGPKKIEKAESQGVQFLNEEQFINLINTGELPEQ